MDRRDQIDEMNSLSEKLSTVEDQLQDSILKNQQKDQIILDKTQEIENFQNDIYRMQNDMTEKDNQIEKQENMINDLKYKIKDDSERFEVEYTNIKSIIQNASYKFCKNELILVPI